MSDLLSSDNSSVHSVDTKARERRLLVFLLIVLFPVLTIMLIGAFGLAVWIWQMFTGPPAL